MVERWMVASDWRRQGQETKDGARYDRFLFSSSLSILSLLTFFLEGFWWNGMGGRGFGVGFDSARRDRVLGFHVYGKGYRFGDRQNGFGDSGLRSGILEFGKVTI